MGLGARSRLYNSTGFFFLAWMAHYIPFFIMGRQLFLHHYLPAHLASSLVAGALVEFIFNIEPPMLRSSAPSSTSDPSSTLDPSSKADSIGSSKAEPNSSPFSPSHPNAHANDHPQPSHLPAPSTAANIVVNRMPVRQRMRDQSLLAVWAAAAVILAAVVWTFFFFAPLTYGQPSLDVKGVLARKWLAYDFHFAK